MRPQVRLIFSLAEQYVVFEESYFYNKKDTVVNKVVLNSNGSHIKKKQNTTMHWVI